MARKTTPAIAYLRVSGRAQVGGHGFKRQRQTIDQFTKAAGLKIAVEYREAHTGTEADRPVFEKMLTDVLSNGCRTIVVESLDRFARDVLVQGALLGRLAAEGVTMYSAATGEDVTAAMAADPMRKAMVQIQGVFAELDKRLLVRKLAKARKNKRQETGRCEGRKPFGTFDGEAEVVDRIRQLRKKRGRHPRPTWQEVAYTLDDEGLPSRSGKPWNPATVWRIARRMRVK